MKMLMIVALISGCDLVNFDDARQSLATADPCDGIAASGPAGVPDASQCVLGSLGVTGDATIRGVIDASGATLHGNLDLGGGSITGAAPVVVTRTIPVYGPQVAGPLISTPAIVSGLGSAARMLFVQLPIQSGVTISSLRARVTDSAGSSAQMKLMDSTDNNQFLTMIASSPITLGNGAEQTISLTSNVIATNGHSYTAVVFDSTGGGPVSIWRLELDTKQ